MTKVTQNNNHSTGFAIAGSLCIENNFEYTPSYAPEWSKEELSMERLGEVWGEDEDGAYERLYNHHKALKALKAH